MARHVTFRGFAAVSDFAPVAALALSQLVDRVVDVFRRVLFRHGTVLKRPRILPALTVATALLPLALVSGVSAQPAPSPIPTKFCGTWNNHSSQIQIDCDKVVQPDSAYTPLASNMTIEGRTYVWCIEPG